MNNSSHEHQNKKKTINSQGIYFLGKTERERARPVMSPSTQSSWFSPRMTRKRRAILSLPRWTDSNIHKPTYGFQEPLDKLKKKKKNQEIYLKEIETEYECWKQVQKSCYLRGKKIRNNTPYCIHEIGVRSPDSILQWPISVSTFKQSIWMKLSGQ